MWHSYWSFRPYPKRFWRSFCLFLLFCDSCYFQISEIPVTSSFKGKKNKCIIVNHDQFQPSWWSLELSTGKYEYRLILMKCFSLRVLIYTCIYFIFYMHMIWGFKNAPIVILKYIINSKKIHQLNSSFCA